MDNSFGFRAPLGALKTRLRRQNDVFGKNYVKDDSFDPARIISSDKFGVAPNNTTIKITYRYNPKPIINVPVAKLSTVGPFLMDFPNDFDLNF